jgi:putative tryptophan/tyrosine transport system substrate-binding protein
MRRREFITLVGGAAASAWPSATHAQGRTARVGALMSFTEANPESKGLVAAIEKQLGAAGWHKDSNLAIDYRWGASDPERFSRDAEELVRAVPDVLLAFGTPALIPLRKSAASIPIVFAAVSDPIGQGFVSNLAHPGGTVTGFSNYDPDIGSKWLQLFKDIAPLATNVTVMFNPRTSPYNVMWMRSIEASAPGLGIVATQESVENDEDIRRIIDLLKTKFGSGLIVPSDSFTYDRSAMIVSLAASSKIPALYAFPHFAHDGGLVAYGVDLSDQVRRAAEYVGRILNGEKAMDLPVQTPTRYTLTINMKAAKALGLTIPLALLGRADEVIE